MAKPFGMDRRDFLRLGAAGLGGGLVGSGLAAPHRLLGGTELDLANPDLRATWTLENDRLRPGRLEDRRAGTAQALGADLFSVELTDGTVLRSSDFRIAGAPIAGRMRPSARASRYAERLPGREIRATLIAPGGHLRAVWRAELHDGSRYLRQEMSFEAVGGDLPVRRITLLDLPVPGARVSGSVQGSPAVTDRLFFGLRAR